MQDVNRWITYFYKKWFYGRNDRKEWYFFKKLVCFFLFYNAVNNGSKLLITVKGRVFKRRTLRTRYKGIYYKNFYWWINFLVIFIRPHCLYLYLLKRKKECSLIYIFFFFSWNKCRWTKTYLRKYRTKNLSGIIYQFYPDC